VPAVVLGLYTRLFHGWGLLVGWFAGTALGTWMAWTLDFKAPVYPLKLFGVTVPCYIALSSLVVNLVIAAVLSVLFHAIATDRHKDATAAEDYA
jgi:SSS family solute:Na+ symporter